MTAVGDGGAEMRRKRGGRWNMVLLVRFDDAEKNPLNVVPDPKM